MAAHGRSLGASFQGAPRPACERRRPGLADTSYEEAPDADTIAEQWAPGKPGGGGVDVADALVVALVTGGLAFAGVVFSAAMGHSNARLAAESAERQDANRARQELNEVQREEIEMLKGRCSELEVQNAALQAKVAAHEGRPARRTT